MSSRKALLVAAFLTASANAVLAQTSTSSPAGTGTPAAQGLPMGSMPGSSGGMPMMGMMQMMLGSMADHVEGRDSRSIDGRPDGHHGYGHDVAGSGSDL